MPERKPARSDSPDWSQLHLWQIQPVRDILAVAAVVGILALGYRLSIVTIPMLLALLLAYLFEPLVRVVTRRGWFSRQGAAIFLIFAAFFVVVVPAIFGLGTAIVQGTRIVSRIATTSTNFVTVMRYTRAAAETAGQSGVVTLPIDDADRDAQKVTFAAPAEADEKVRLEATRARAAYNALPRAGRALAIHLIEQNQEHAGSPAAREEGTDGAAPVERTPSAAEPPALVALADMAISWIQNNASALAATVGRQALGGGAEAISALVRTFRSLTTVALMSLLTAFFFFFFSSGYGKVLAFWEGLIPERKKGRVIELVTKMDAVIAGFVRGRLLIAFCLMILYTVGYWFIGVPAPLLIGPIIGALAIIPFVSTIAIPLAMILMAIEPSSWAWQNNWWWILAGPPLVYAMERLLDDYTLTPLIQGKNTDMDVPSILFASLAGGVLAGIYGLLIAIPVAACIKILLKELFWPRFKDWAEGRRKDFLPLEEAPGKSP